MAETAARHFAGESDLLLVEVDGDALGDALRHEPSRGGDLFPHLYGPLPLAVVRSVRPLPLGPDGRHVFPDLAPRPDDPARHGWTIREEAGLMRLLGPIWSRQEDGVWRYGFTAEERHLNRSAIVHGGMLMAFADEALGRTASLANDRTAQVTIQLDTHFVASAKAGEFVTAECRVVRRSRSLLFMAGTLTAGGRIVATATGVWKVLGA